MSAVRMDLHHDKFGKGLLWRIFQANPSDKNKVKRTKEDEMALVWHTLSTSITNNIS